MRASFAALLLASLVGLVLSSAAAAKEAVHVSGTYTVTDFGTTTCVPVGSSAYRIRCATTGFATQYGGDLTGTAIVDFTTLIDCRTGRSHGKGVETFTGTVNGLGAGTLIWHDHFRSTIDCGTFEVSDLVGKEIDFSGTGQLAAVRGKIDYDETTYDGTLH